MSQLPPLYRDQRLVDISNLKWLAICHFLGAGLAVLGLLMVMLHFAVVQFFLSDPSICQNSSPGPPPASFIALFYVFYPIFGLFYFVSAVLNVLSGLFIQARKHSMFSLVVAGANCVHMPLGTILGIFTFVVLLRGSVRELYDAAA